MDAGFDLGYKLDFKFDPAEKKVLEATSRQQLAQNCLEYSARAAASAWQLMHTTDKEKADLQSLQKQVMDLTLIHSECGPKYKAALHTINEGRIIFEGLHESLKTLQKEHEQQTHDFLAAQKANDELVVERNVLKSSLMAFKAQEMHMAKAIILEHTRGFKKAIRQASHFLERPLSELPFNVDQDVLKGNLVPSKEVFVGTYSDNEDDETDSPE